MIDFKGTGSPIINQLSSKLLASFIKNYGLLMKGEKNRFCKDLQFYSRVPTKQDKYHCSFFKFIITESAFVILKSKK